MVARLYKYKKKIGNFGAARAHKKKKIQIPKLKVVN